jgi:hypothetical protein
VLAEEREVAGVETDGEGVGVTGGLETGAGRSEGEDGTAAPMVITAFDFEKEFAAAGGGEPDGVVLLLSPKTTPGGGGILQAGLVAGAAPNERVLCRIALLEGTGCKGGQRGRRHQQAGKTDGARAEMAIRNEDKNRKTDDQFNWRHQQGYASEANNREKWLTCDKEPQNITESAPRRPNMGPERE